MSSQSMTEPATEQRNNSISQNENGKHISFTKTKSVSLKVKNLTIGAVKSQKQTTRIPILGKFIQKKDGIDIESNDRIKTVLYPMSFNIPANSMTCIVGGSGSGKTTLLNSLAHRHFAKSSLCQSGEISYHVADDDSSYHNLQQIRHAYVIQQDILIPTLTCFETLMFAAELKLTKSTTHESMRRLVDEIILELGLKDCRDTLVGDKHNKGLSGGEKRRLSVALQLISNPSVLFLDEPTTGLDSYNAYLLCLSLQKLAKNLGKTIIMSIHQPRADIFKLFDNVLILSKGRLCYGDSYSKLLSHFESIGYPVPELNANPADFLMETKDGPDESN
ncbi:unnamed protein product [Ambrosiozyma monospora]|uniref:Unnamed protein product n=1 Tax=Ambrosiozyma monospora TaxID=43982 RepID=A0ACB5SW40_AMBMO|nr:unnamed protein product [Ambrosiozyma monospora]